MGNSVGGGNSFKPVNSCSWVMTGRPRDLNYVGDLFIGVHKLLLFLGLFLKDLCCCGVSELLVSGLEWLECVMVAFGDKSLRVIS